LRIIRYLEPKRTVFLRTALLWVIKQRIMVIS